MSEAKVTTPKQEFMSRELFEMRGYDPTTYEAQREKFNKERDAAARLTVPSFGEFRVKAGAGNLTAYGAADKRHWAPGELLEGVSIQDIAHFWKLGVIELAYQPAAEAKTEGTSDEQ